MDQLNAIAYRWKVSEHRRLLLLNRPPCDFIVTVQRNDTCTSIGLELIHGPSTKQQLIVQTVRPDGLIPRWNARHIDAQMVHAGDCIIFANDAHGASTDIIKAIKAANIIQLGILRGQSDPRPDSTVTSMLSQIPPCPTDSTDQSSDLHGLDSFLAGRSPDTHPETSRWIGMMQQQQHQQKHKWLIESDGYDYCLLCRQWADPAHLGSTKAPRSCDETGLVS